MVTDIVAARHELTGQGVEVDEIRHITDGAWRPGPDPDRANYMSFAEFTDPPATCGCSMRSAVTRKDRKE